MPLQYLEDSNYTDGMIRDTPPWLLPNGAVYDALNMIFDKPGVARHRSGTTAIFSGSQTAFCSVLGFVFSQDVTVIEELYGCNVTAGLSVYAINKTTGVATSLGSTTFSGPSSRPVRHFGFLCFTGLGTSVQFNRCQWVAGQTTVSNFVSATAVTVTAGNPQFTLGGADTTTNIKVGAIVQALNGTTNTYYGRVISVDSATKFTVWPTPGITFTTSATGMLTSAEAIGVGADTNAFGGACVTSFQNRVLFGNVNDPSNSTNPTRNDRRIAYSVLPTENVTFNAGGITGNGATFLAMNRWPASNFLDIPGADPIVAMEPVTDNELLILTSTHPVVFRGNLITQLSTTSQQVTWDVSDINQPTGCLSDLSVQRTARGVVWAGSEGVYAFDGSNEIKDLTAGPPSDRKGRISTYWKALSAAPNFIIHGAAYFRGHYMISGTSNGATFSLLCNMDNLQWTRLTGSGTDIFNGVARPTAPSQVFVARWWDTSGGGPSMTNGQVVRAESMLDPYTVGATKTDADAVAVQLSLTTRSIAGDPELQKIFSRATLRASTSLTVPNPNLQFQGKPGIDVGDILQGAGLGFISNNLVLVITAATNATPIVCTTGVAHGLQSDDFIDVVGGLGNTHVNGRWRIAVLSTSTFSLVGSTGNGAYTASSAQFRKITETDYQLTQLAQSQAIAFTILSNGAVNNLELHGIRVAYYANEPVMST